MKQFITHIAVRSLLLVISLQILNLSINGIDFKPVYTSNISEFNDMNSLTEFVSEVVLGKVNYFPEFDKKAQKQSQIQKHISIKIINEQFTPITADLFKMESKVTIPYKAGDLNEYYQEINPPPPKI